MMKLSTKIILPILLISALLILLTGCFLVPPKEEPGYTPGTVTGTMARPMVCCEDPEGELVGDPITPNICDELCIPFNTVDWYAWTNVQVVLTTWVDSEEVELATTVTDANGDYIFSDVPPDINYIITAICPTDEEFVIKDVVEELVEGGIYDAGIADAESTVLALCLDGLGEIGLDSYLLDLDDFRSHDYYDEVIEEVCGYLADCDHAIPLWVCVLTELCPGYTPAPVYTPTPSPVTYTLTMAADLVGGGTTSPAVGAHPDYTAGAVENITATPASGYHFNHWSSNVTDPDSASTTVTMDGDKTVTATFTLKEVTLTMAVAGTGSGTVAPIVGVHTYNYGDTVTISVTADASSDFTGWSGDASGTGDVTLTMTENKSVIATFTLKTYTITASAGANGVITPSVAVGVSHGADQSFTIDPDTNYHIDDVLVDGTTSLGAVASYTFTGVTADHTIEATFAIDTYTSDDGNDCYGLSFSYVYYPDTNKTTFEYTVREKWEGDEGDCKEIEKIKLEFGIETWGEDVIISMNVVDGSSTFEEKITDKEIKMDKLQPGFIAGIITITFNGNVGAVDGTLNIKAQGPGNDWDFDVDKPNI